MAPHTIDVAIHRAVKKERIFSPCHGFYVVVPEEYRLWKAVPQEFYLDKMMQYLGRAYYVSLLSAAEKHGAAHQAPMVLQVMVEPPVLRDKKSDGYAINYTERQRILIEYVERREVSSGWLNVSCPELTAVDLIYYQNRIGGLTRASTVLEELAHKLDFANMNESFLQLAPVPVFQRLGYLLDRVLEETKIADGLLELVSANGMRMKAAPLRLGTPIENSNVDKKWKVIVNQIIQTDEL